MWTTEFINGELFADVSMVAMSKLLSAKSSFVDDGKTKGGSRLLDKDAVEEDSSVRMCVVVTEETWTTS